MVIANEILGKLPGIGNHLLTDAVLNKCFLEQGIPTVFFVGQDAFDVGDYPFRLPSCGEAALILQLAFLNLPKGTELVEESFMMCWEDSKWPAN